MDYEITIREMPEQRVASLRGRTTYAALSAFIGSSFDELAGGLAAAGTEPAAEAVVIYHAFGPAGIDAEVCLPVAPEADVGDLRTRVLPAATVATALHRGSYVGLPGAYAAIAAWIRAEGFDDAGPSRERYIVGPERGVPEAAYRTLVETPISRSRTPIPAPASPTSKR